VSSSPPFPRSYVVGVADTAWVVSASPPPPTRGEGAGWDTTKGPADKHPPAFGAKRGGETTCVARVILNIE